MGQTSYFKQKNLSQVPMFVSHNGTELSYLRRLPLIEAKYPEVRIKVTGTQFELYVNGNLIIGVNLNAF